MGRVKYFIHTRRFNVVFPIFLIICFVGFSFFFYKFFVQGPQQKVEHIEQLIAEEKYAEAADLLYDFSYKNYATRETLKQVCEGKPELVLYSLGIGDTFYFGNYEQDNNYDNGPEPIEWQVLDQDGRKMLIQTTKVIEEKAYHEESFSILKWKETALYAYLNNVLFYSAFNELQRNLILQSKEGTVFLLDYDMGKKYSTDEISAMNAEPTEYVRQNYNPEIEEDGTTEVWTKTEKIYGNDYRMKYVNGIRPVMWINVSTLVNENMSEGVIQ